MKRLSPVMLAGTGSDVGKSMIATGLCRIFFQDGYFPAPFKAQNMALNSYATPDGKEIGRAQAVQAEAAGIPCSTDMNPLLLKPSGDHTSQVVLNGIPIGNRDSYTYYREEGRDVLRREVQAAFDRLAACHNPIVMEGAGSIAEINLKETDLVNMSMARYAGAKVILVADIDRGGVFASAYGSIMLQEPDDRKRIKGIIVNKFRGDLRLFEKGRAMMEEVCGVPVLGVVPFATDIHIDEEDSVALAQKNSRPVAGKINVAVVRLGHISNYTDFDTMERHPDVNLYYTDSPDLLRESDIIILPGSKATVADLRRLKESGLAKAITDAYEEGKQVIGICGGYQMMGTVVSDTAGVEGEPCEETGLGLLPVATEMDGKKITRRVRFRFMGSDSIDGGFKGSGFKDSGFKDSGALCEGYEIHNGRTTPGAGATAVCRMEDGTPDGCVSGDGRAFGTYIHGILDNADVIRHILSRFPDRLTEPGRVIDYKRYKDSQYDMLADHLRRYVDMERLYKIMSDND